MSQSLKSVMKCSKCLASSCQKSKNMDRAKFSSHNLFNPARILSLANVRESELGLQTLGQTKSNICTRFRTLVINLTQHGQAQIIHCMLQYCTRSHTYNRASIYKMLARFGLSTLAEAWAG